MWILIVNSVKTTVICMKMTDLLTFYFTTVRWLVTKTFYCTAAACAHSFDIATSEMVSL